SALLLLSYAFIFLLRVVPSMSRILSFFVILKQHQILAYNIANQFYSLTKLSSRITDSNRVISFTSMNRIRFQDYQLISPSGELIKKNINVDFVGNGINLIQGKNGSGKSTLLKSITGQVLSNSGSLVINVMNQSKNLEDRIQFLSQHSGVSSKTLNSNIDLGSNLSQLESDEAYKILSKLNYVFLNAQKVLKGSGGEIQKVFISRILCKNADIFLLDEPTNHLDKKSHKELAEIIIDKSRHSLILVASHDDQFISLLPINTSYLI
ncbi:MAG: hypothetical protein RLZ57_221, partial [Actinomycetota bacterium]